MDKVGDNQLILLYDFNHTTTDGRQIAVKQNEKLFLINKTNKDWWQVIRSWEERPFLVPSEYVREAKAAVKDAKADYQNLNFHRSKIQKPIPKARTQLKKPETTDKRIDNDSDSSLGSDNRMRNSYNLKTNNYYECPKIERKPTINNRKQLEISKNLSKSLEKLAEQIKFEPKFKGTTNSLSKVEASASTFDSNKDVKNLQNKAVKNEEKSFFRSSVRGKSRDVDMILNENCSKLNTARSSDASILLNERRIAPKSRGSIFSSFKRKKRSVCVVVVMGGRFGKFGKISCKTVGDCGWIAKK